MHATYNLAAAAILATAVSAATQKVVVGGSAGLVFTPSSVTAAVGDVVEFHFEKNQHSVAQGDFSTGCSPGSITSPFYSGIIMGDTAGTQTFSITIENTDPLFFYCSYADHCIDGMVGAINPSSGMTLDMYKSTAGSFSGTPVSPPSVNSMIGGGSGSGSMSSTSSAMMSETTEAATSSMMEMSSSTMAMESSTTMMESSMAMTTSSMAASSTAASSTTPAASSTAAMVTGSGAGAVNMPWKEAVGVSGLIGLLAALML